jgi:hypothetical protein
MQMSHFIGQKWVFLNPRAQFSDKNMLPEVGEAIFGQI